MAEDYDYIDINPEWAPDERQGLSDLQKKMVTEFFRCMKARGVTAVRAEFRGENDSGNIDDIYFTGLHGKEITLEQMLPLENMGLQTQNGTIYSEGRSRPNIQPFEPANLKDFAEEVANQVACAPGYDWWNNDGGQGHVIFYHDDVGDHIQLLVGVNTKTTEEHAISVEF